MTPDPFSEMLEISDAQFVISGHFVAGGSWGIRFSKGEKLTFSALLKGNCWIRVEDAAAPVFIQEGDIFLIAAQRSFVVASSLDAKTVSADEIFTETGSGQIGNTQDCIHMGACVMLDAASSAILADILPPMILVKSTSPKAPILRWILEQLMEERKEDLPGRHLVSTKLTVLMFVQILRSYLESSDNLEAGWLKAFADKRISPALRLMHRNPEKSWQLKELAKVTAMSRTNFATHFKTVAGVPPLTYLNHWRMRLAERALRNGGVSMACLAEQLGYSSDSAFSHAFKKAVGISPRKYREMNQVVTVTTVVTNKELAAL